MATWATHSIAATAGMTTMVCASPDVFVGSGGNSSDDFYRSTDGGATWGAVASPLVGGGAPFLATDGAGNLVCVVSGNITDIGYSSDSGATWNVTTAPAANNWRGVCWFPGASLWVAVSINSGGGAPTLVMTSPDMINWSLQTASSNLEWNQVVASPTLVMAISTSNEIMTSPNGTAWTTKTTMPATYNAGSGAVLGYSTVLGAFVSGGYDASLVPISAIAISSTDGAAWAQCSSDTATALFTMLPTDAIGGFVSMDTFDATNPPFTTPTPTDAASSIDAGASWVHEVVPSGSWFGPLAWDNTNGIFAVYDPVTTVDVLVGTFSVAAIVTSVDPTHGDKAGGTVVTLGGTGFTGKTIATFNGSTTLFTPSSDTAGTCITPAHAVGQVTVTVS